MILRGMPPRCGKSFMTEAINRLGNDVVSAYDKAYSQIFNELKDARGDTYSDGEIHNWINNNLIFELNVEDSSFIKTPELIVTVKMREVSVD